MDEPKSYTVAHVHEALARANELNIDVAVAGNRVFLTGTVASPERKASCARVVEELLPDHEVVNEIEVAPFSEPEEAEEIS